MANRKEPKTTRERKTRRFEVCVWVLCTRVSFHKKFSRRNTSPESEFLIYIDLMNSQADAVSFEFMKETKKNDILMVMTVNKRDGRRKKQQIVSLCIWWTEKCICFSFLNKFSRGHQTRTVQLHVYRVVVICFYCLRVSVANSEPRSLHDHIINNNQLFFLCSLSLKMNMKRMRKEIAVLCVAPQLQLDS